MDAIDTTQLVLLLTEVPGIGEHTLAAVLRRNAVLRRPPEMFLRLPKHVWVGEYGMRRAAADYLQAQLERLTTYAVNQARALRRAGVDVITLLDATYPHRLLRSLHPTPPAVYLYGNHRLLSARLFATAVSNNASETALNAVELSAVTAVENGWTPITGHNRAAYQRPALVAHRRGARIFYVLDRGIADAFGADLSQELFAAARIWSPGYDPQRDLTLSSFGLHEHAVADHNRKRDAMVFALADVIVAAGVKAGGQMEQRCQEALSTSKRVIVVAVCGEGDERLIRAGALLVEPACIADCLAETPIVMHAVDG